MTHQEQRDNESIIETCAVECALAAVEQWRGARDDDGNLLLDATAEPAQHDFEFLQEEAGDVTPDGKDLFVCIYQQALAEIIASDEAARRCAYCGELARRNLPAVPDADDDIAWDDLLVDHAPHCAWLDTRAHQRAGSNAVSDALIERLRNEAGEHGDVEQAALCELALEGDAAARAQCVKVIEDARAQR